MEAVIHAAFRGSAHHYDLCHTERPGHATELAATGVSAGREVVVAVGGDGTVNEGGSARVGTGCLLGVVPLGSGNAFARALQLPLRPAAACRLLRDCRVTHLDVGRIDEHFFFSTAGIGIAAQVSARYAAGAHRRGFLPYATAAVAAVRQSAPEPVAVAVDGEEFYAGPLALLTVANTGQYGYGLRIAPGARPDDGLLDVCLIGELGLPTLLRHGWRLFAGSVAGMPGAVVGRGRTIRIERAAAGPIQVDGESYQAGRVLDVGVEGAVRVAVAPPGD